MRPLQARSKKGGAARKALIPAEDCPSGKRGDSPGGGCVQSRKELVLIIRSAKTQINETHLAYGLSEPGVLFRSATFEGRSCNEKGTSGGAAAPFVGCIGLFGDTIIRKGLLQTLQLHFPAAICLAPRLRKGTSSN